MHVVQILPALEEGGVERGTVELNREFVRRGHVSSVISSGGGLVSVVEREGGRHWTLDVKSKNPLTAWSRAASLRRLLAEIRPDLIHFRSRVPGWLVRLANGSLRLPVVSTVHGFNSVSPYSRIMTTGERVICPSTAVLDYVRAHYGTPRQRLRLIPRGIDPQRFDPAKTDAAFMADFRRSFALEGRFVVLGVGRITQLKGYDVLIDATAAARERLPTIKTVIVGGAEPARAEYAEILRERVRNLGLEDHVVFAGSQSRVADIYACGDVLVSGNRSKPEAFGRSMAEALAMGCPVIATRFGGALDIVREGINGWLVEPGDVAQLADRLVEASRHTLTGLREDALARFSLDQMVNKTLAVYEEVLAARRTEKKGEPR
ncbi:MAG TPA: glycosyltransferase family 4 protein [Kiritimatiellia bacterium]|nr:glycosyltransferase family 4 protein [Kiritimatiellia bacterium]HRU71475.1 glycosyltransferase family 4 protein [Kiritimatiellia bacterium]